MPPRFVRWPHYWALGIVLALPSCGTDATTGALPATSSREVRPNPNPPNPVDGDGPNAGAALAAEDIERHEAPEAEGREQLVVDLAVEWRPEHELSDEEVRLQRARIETAQDEVLGDLGAHGRLSRRLTATAQMAVSVDDEGRQILAGHRLVAAVHDDEPDRPDAPSD